MKNEFSIASFLTRIGITILVLSVIYLCLGPPSYSEVELVNEVLYLFLVPIILIPGTVIIVFLIGMPVRLIPRIFHWWTQRPYIALLGVIIGITICLLSIHPYFIETISLSSEEGQNVKSIPNFNLLCVGWFFTSFFLFHFYPEALAEFVTMRLHQNKKRAH